MQPYVVKQGDYLLSIANALGFSADTAWNDDSNSALRALRPDPNILFPGDVLQVPDPNSPPPTSLTTGSANNFVSNVPTAPLTVKFVGPIDATTYASKAFTVQELDQLTGLTTDGDGVATFQIPVSLDTVTITFTDSGDTCVLSIGAMDPINTLSGTFKRLQNLGYIGQDVTFDPTALDGLRAGLLMLKASQPGGDSPPPSSPPASAPPASAPPASAPPASNPPGSNPPPASGAASASSPPPPSSQAPASNPPPASGAGPASNPPPASGAAPDSSPPSSDSAPGSSLNPINVLASLSSQDSTPPPSGATGDSSGLSDDGTLDAATQALLIQAHGS
jgi:hypothetical protein